MDMNNPTNVDDPTKNPKKVNEGGVAQDEFSLLSQEEKKEAFDLLQKKKRGELKEALDLLELKRSGDLVTFSELSAERKIWEERVNTLKIKQEEDLSKNIQIVADLQKINREFDLGVDFSHLDVENLKSEIRKALISRLGINYKMTVDLGSDIENLATILRHEWLNLSRDSLGKGNEKSGLTITSPWDYE